MMNRVELISEIKKFFKLEELVCKHVMNKYNETQMWSFFSTQALETLLVLRRDIIKKPFIINNWKSPSGNYTQRGLRCNLCQIPKEKTRLEKVYMSAHCTGNAFDITVVGMSAEEARKLIDLNKHKLPYPIRLERDVTWLHFDVYDMGTWDKITYFKG